jgi:hypothetical protein
MRTIALRAAIVAALATTTLAACDRQDMARAERDGAAVGRKADDALAHAGDSLAQAGKKAEEKTREALASVESSMPADGTAAHSAMSDTAITASIKADFIKDPDLSVLKIDVDTREGVVTLNGLADNDAARSRAERIASGVKGVRQVRNFLVTKKA